MVTIEELGSKSSTFKNRNPRVETNVTRVTSITRRLPTLAMSYVVMAMIYYLAESPSPWVKAIVPALIIFLLKLAASWIKSIWIKQRK